MCDIGGSRASTAMHLQVAKDHGFTDIAEVDIMDANGETALPVAGGKNLTENFVGSHFENYDSFVVLSHFKGHANSDTFSDDIFEQFNGFGRIIHVTGGYD